MVVCAANSWGLSARISPAKTCAAASGCRASAVTTATWSTSDLCWFSLKLPSICSTVITRPTIACIIASRRPVVISLVVHGGFGASQLSKLALSASI